MAELGDSLRNWAHARLDLFHLGLRNAARAFLVAACLGLCVTAVIASGGVLLALGLAGGLRAVLPGAPWGADMLAGAMVIATGVAAAITWQRMKNRRRYASTVSKYEARDWAAIERRVAKRRAPAATQSGAHGTRRVGASHG